MSFAYFIMEFSFTAFVRVNVMSELLGRRKLCGSSFVVPCRLFVILKFVKTRQKKILH